MRRMFAGAIAWLCLISGLVLPEQAAADPELSDCPQSTQNPVQIAQGVQSLNSPNPRASAKLTGVVFTPDASDTDDGGSAPAQGLNVKLRTEGCWGQPQASQGPDGSQIIQFQRGGNGTVAVTAEMSAEPRDLADVLAYDRKQMLDVPTADSGAKSASQTVVLENEAGDYQGNSSWLVRIRSTVRGRDGRSDVFETTTREIVVAGGENTYLVTVAGTASASAEPGAPAASLDPDSANAVYEQVKNGVTVAASR